MIYLFKIFEFRLNTEVTQLRLVKATLTNEVEEYRTLAERRRGDIEALNVDCKRLTEQLAEANAAKCEALVRSEDIAAKEIGKISNNVFFYILKMVLLSMLKLFVAITKLVERELNSKKKTWKKSKIRSRFVQKGK